MSWPFLFRVCQTHYMQIALQATFDQTHHPLCLWSAAFGYEPKKGEIKQIMDEAEGGKDGISFDEFAALMSTRMVLNVDAADRVVVL